MKQTLFDIRRQEIELVEALEEAGGEIPPELETMFDEFTKNLTHERDLKLNSYAYAMRNLEIEAEALKAEEQRLAKRRKTKERVRELLKQRLFDYLKSSGNTKIDTGRFKFTVARNGGKCPIILNEYFQRNPAELPERYRKVEFKPDLERLREDLESEDDWEDAISIASLSERGENLRIS